MKALEENINGPDWHLQKNDSDTDSDDGEEEEALNDYRK